MRSKIAQRLIDQTPDEIKEKVDAWADNMVLGNTMLNDFIDDVIISKRFIVMYEDGHYYGSFSPLGVWETYEGAEIAQNKWKQENPSKQTCIEEVDYNAC